jgi:hypothetical protein
MSTRIHSHKTFDILFAICTLAAAALAVSLIPIDARGCEEPEGPELVDLSVARRIVDRQPLQIGELVEADGGRVYVHMTFYNAGPPTTVDVQITRGDQIIFTTALEVGQSPRWRTWVYLKASEAMTGEYQVRVKDTVFDYELAEASFTIASAREAKTGPAKAASRASRDEQRRAEPGKTRVAALKQYEGKRP